MKEIKPNFFIIGAPKCGTTAMFSYLTSHPNIYMSEPKELHYFADEIGTSTRRKAHNMDQYLKFFNDCNDTHIAVGEGTPTYLSSPTAIRKIHSFNPNAKIIIMLRNPVDLVCSYHSQLVFRFMENERDVEKAWRLQDLRSTGKKIPKACKAPMFLQYSNTCSLGKQVEHVLSIFPREQVKFVLLDDLKKSTATQYSEVLTFLNVPHDGRSSFPRVNENKERSSWLMGNLYSTIRHSEPLATLVNSLKKLLGVNKLGIRGKIVRKRENKTRQPIRDEFRIELEEFFREDVKKLGAILDRDLSHWYKSTLK